MSNTKLVQKISALQKLKRIEKITIVRREGYSGARIKSHSVPKWAASNRVLTDLYRGFLSFLLCLKNKPDIIISFYMYYHGLMAWLFGRIFKIPVIQVLIGTDLEKSLKSRRMISLLRSADVIAVEGQYSAERLASAGLNRSKILWPTTVFKISDYMPKNNEKPDYDLIFVGSLVEVKRIDRLLRITAALKKKDKGIRLAIAGDGPLRASLEKLAHHLGISDNVTFCGAVSNSEIPVYLCRSRVFIMTSETEGLPVAMLEALSCGLPVVVPDVGDIRSVVTHGKNGLLVDFSNKDTVVQILWKVLTDAAFYNILRHGAIKTRAKLDYEYSLEAVSKVWDRAIDLVYGEKNLSLFSRRQ
ncbi:MAG TPA: glycosyltransferase [Desulfobacteraceae bacterium]|nr:glycosyltransferase [Desulfobacteraceae bacterium]